MSSSEFTSETGAEGGPNVADRTGSLAEALAPTLADHARSGNLAAASGVVSLARAGRTFLKGNRKRGVLQALAGLFWVGVALAQRRSAGSDERGAGRTTGGDFSDVVDTSPDIEGIETEETGTDHATGEDIVDTTAADIDETDTGPEVEVSPDVAREIDEDVDQRDVASTDEVAESGSDATADDAEVEADGKSDDQ